MLVAVGGTGVCQCPPYSTVIAGVCVSNCADGSIQYLNSDGTTSCGNPCTAMQNLAVNSDRTYTCTTKTCDTGYELRIIGTAYQCAPSCQPYEVATFVGGAWTCPNISCTSSQDLVNTASGYTC